MGEKVLLMGNEAIARGAVEAGVQVAAAYPGTPSSEVFSTLAASAKEFGIYAEWSVNEKVALEVAAGAAFAGARSIVTMKQVGLNVAADPLMTLAYIGVKGGLVLVVADDPGPHSSQNEQDTRHFAKFAKLPVLDPSTPQEAKDMTAAAFGLSEALGLPVIVRPTTRVSHACQDVELGEVQQTQRKPVFEKSPSWVIFPSLAFQRHQWLNRQQGEMARLYGDLPFNKYVPGGRTGIIAGGVSATYVAEALVRMVASPSFVKIGTPYPLPEQPVLDFLRSVDRVIVIEEQDPVIEEQVIELAWKHRLTVEIAGKKDGSVPAAGEFNVNVVEEVLGKFFGESDSADRKAAPPPPWPVRTPVLCAGCPHRASFYAFKVAARGTDPVFTGDIGCYTLGTMPPLKAVDTCLCMGASITIASGLEKAEPGRKHVAFLGDSTFFHTGVPGLINAVYNQTHITVVILDNRTTAMTGHQPHPGLGRTALGGTPEPVDLAKLVAGCGIKFIREVDPCDHARAVAAAREALNFPGPAVVIMKRECISLVKRKTRYQVDRDSCVDCGVCCEELGCPAIARVGGVEITDNCFGCGICAQICPAEAIREVSTS